MCCVGRDRPTSRVVEEGRPIVWMGQDRGANAILSLQKPAESIKGAQSKFMEKPDRRGIRSKDISFFLGSFIYTGKYMVSNSMLVCIYA